MSGDGGGWLRWFTGDDRGRPVASHLCRVRRRGEVGPFCPGTRPEERPARRPPVLRAPSGRRGRHVWPGWPGGQPANGSRSGRIRAGKYSCDKPQYHGRFAPPRSLPVWLNSALSRAGHPPPVGVYRAPERAPRQTPAARSRLQHGHQPETPTRGWTRAPGLARSVTSVMTGAPP